LNGILISQPYADEIISGKKNMEYRKGQVPIDYLNSSIYLLCEGIVLGEIEFTKQKKIPNTDMWIWYVQVLQKYDIPKTYYHPSSKKLFVNDVITSNIDNSPRL